MDSNRVFRRNPNIVWQIVDGEALLVLPHNGQIKVLNHVGAAIWGLLDGKRTVDEVWTSLCSQFDVPVKQLDRELSLFLKQLSERELITG